MPLTEEKSMIGINPTENINDDISLEEDAYRRVYAA